MRPRIIIPTNYRDASGDSPAQAYINDAYVKAVYDAGGLPVLATPRETFEEAVAAEMGMDGLLLTGGADLDPALYGQPRHPKATPLNLRRQAWELAWFAYAEKVGRPVLGICLGCQLINVARGGSLIQFLPEVPGKLDHGGGGRDGWHDVDVTAPMLRQIAGQKITRVNSRHRQAIDRLGRGLVAAAKSADGVVEAVEGNAGHSEAQKFLLAVQWHPEDLPDHPATTALFHAFIRAAGG